MRSIVPASVRISIDSVSVYEKYRFLKLFEHQNCQHYEMFTCDLCGEWGWQSGGRNFTLDLYSSIRLSHIHELNEVALFSLPVFLFLFRDFNVDIQPQLTQYISTPMSWSLEFMMISFDHLPVHKTLRFKFGLVGSTHYSARNCGEYSTGDNWPRLLATAMSTLRKWRSHPTHSE